MTAYLRLWPMSLWRERAQLLYQGAAFDQLMTTGGLDLCLLSWYCHDLFFSDINHYIINTSKAEGYVVWRWLNFRLCRLCLPQHGCENHRFTCLKNLHQFWHFQSQCLHQTPIVACSCIRHSSCFLVYFLVYACIHCDRKYLNWCI